MQKGRYCFANSVKTAFVGCRMDGTDVVIEFEHAPALKVPFDSLCYSPGSAPWLHEYRLCDDSVLCCLEPLPAGRASFSQKLGWFEKSRAISVLALLCIPVLLFLLVFRAVPAFSAVAANFISDKTYQSIGAGYLAVLDKGLLDDSQLSAKDKTDGTRLFRDLARRHGSKNVNYRLLFRDSARMGANALALPDGTIVVTDDLVGLIGADSEPMAAVMLHEIGHVERKHSGRIIVQSVSNSYLFSMIGGDFDGVAEVLAGAGSGLLNNSFSRSMEQEADDFSLAALQRERLPPQALGLALRKMLEDNGGKAQQTVRLAEYMSSHPDIYKRIHAAENYGKDAK